MPVVLCYGDSNTWGASVEDDIDGRYPYPDRWPSVCEQQLGADWMVIAEGLNGRTTVSDDPIEGAWRNGRRTLLPILHSHKPLDWVVLMLGTNDLKERFNKSAHEIALGVGVLVEEIQTAAVGANGNTPDILVIAPPPILEQAQYPMSIFRGGAFKSQALAEMYADVADEHNVFFFDAGTIIRSSDYDGIHFSQQAHQALGLAIAGTLLAHHH